MSEGLSERLNRLSLDGRTLIDDSSKSEKTLRDAILELIEYSSELFKPYGTIEHVKSLTLYDCQMYFHKCGGPIPNPENKNVSMKPDGGIIMLRKDDELIPILIMEDKVQGTNDKLFAEGKKRQATGNAIERAAKNMRGAEMIFSNMDIFPYVIFASGCDFHSSETISKRLEMMNMGFPNHYIEINPTTTEEVIQANLDTILTNINIKKIMGKSISSIFVKAHRWNEMKHLSSLWNKNEIISIGKEILNQVFISLK